MSRKQQQVIDNLLEENRILKQPLDASGKKLRSSNGQRRDLAREGTKLKWTQLQEFANIVRPATILAWHRRFVALKYTGKRISMTPKRERG